MCTLLLTSLINVTDSQLYVYVLLGVVLLLAGGLMLFYCINLRRLRLLEQRDNMHNNMQRHLLEDSVLHDGQVEWQCSVCYHENHPAKRECLMCGTSDGMVKTLCHLFSDAY